MNPEPSSPYGGISWRRRMNLQHFSPNVVFYLPYPWPHMYFLFWVPERNNFPRAPPFLFLTDRGGRFVLSEEQESGEELCSSRFQSPPIFQYHLGHI